MSGSVDLGTLLAGVGLDLRALRRDHAEAKGIIGDLSMGLGKLQEAASFIGVSVGIGALVKQIYEVGSAYEESMTKIRAQTRAASIDMIAVQEAVKNARVPAVAEEAAAVLASTLHDVSDVVVALPPLLDFMKAHTQSADQAWSAIHQTMLAFNMGISQTNRVTDIFTAGAFAAKETVGEFQAAMAAAAPASAAMGISIEQTAAMIALLSSRGKQGAAAGAGLVQAERLAVKVGTDYKLGTTDLLGVLDALRDRHMTGQQVIQIFGGRLGVTAGIIYNAMGDLKSLNAEMERANGSTKDVAAEMRDDLGSELKELRGDFQRVGIEAYDTQVDTLRESAASLHDEIRQDGPAIVDFIRAVGTVARTVWNLGSIVIHFVMEAVNEVLNLVDMATGLVANVYLGRFTHIFEDLTAANDKWTARIVANAKEAYADLNDIKESWQWVVNPIGMSDDFRAWMAKGSKRYEAPGTPGAGEAGGGTTPGAGAAGDGSEGGGSAPLTPDALAELHHKAYQQILADTDMSRKEMLAGWKDYYASQLIQIESDKQDFITKTGDKVTASRQAKAQLDALDRQGRELTSPDLSEYFDSIIGSTRGTVAQLSKTWDAYRADRVKQIEFEKAAVLRASGDEVLTKEWAEAQLAAFDAKREDDTKARIGVQADAYQSIIGDTRASVSEMSSTWDAYTAIRLVQIEAERVALLAETQDGALAAKWAQEQILALDRERDDDTKARDRNRTEAQIKAVQDVLDSETATRDEVKGAWTQYHNLRIDQIRDEADELRKAGATEVQVARWVQEELKKLNKEGKKYAGEAQAWVADFALHAQKALSDVFFDAITAKLNTWKDLWRSVLTAIKSMIDDLARAIADDLSKALIDGLKGQGEASFLGSIGKFVSGLFGAGGGSPFTSSGGGGGIGIDDMGGWHGAQGGVVTRPTWGVFGEDGPEAVIPLADYRKALGGAGGQQPLVIHMHITTPDVAGFKASQTQIGARLYSQFSAAQRKSA